MIIHDESDPIEVAVKTKLKEGQVFRTLSELCQLCEIPSFYSLYCFIINCLHSAFYKNETKRTVPN